MNRPVIWSIVMRAIVQIEGKPIAVNDTVEACNGVVDMMAIVLDLEFVSRILLASERVIGEGNDVLVRYFEVGSIVR